MKRWWKAYFTHSAAETKGIVALLLITLILVIIYALMPLFVHPGPQLPDPRLVAAFERYRKGPNIETSAEEPAAISGELFPFDPNTLDSMGFLRLGLRPQTTRMLLNWRRKGKTFYRPEDLKALYTLKEEEYNRLAPFIVISSAPARPQAYSSFTTYEPLPATIDLNAADSATLVRLNGIGPVLAHKIVVRRKALGGFWTHEQLKEIYRFPDTTFRQLKSRLSIDRSKLRRLNLNKATLEQLAAHGYIGEQMAKNILLYREGLKRFDDIDQLRQVPLMNEENYRKIAPYFVLE